MIAYIFKTKDNQIGVCEDQNLYFLDCSLTNLLNKLAHKNLSTLSGRIIAAKKKFGYKSKVPIYIDGTTLFMPLAGIRSQTSFLLNYHAVKSFRKSSVDDIVIALSGFHEIKLEGCKNIKNAFAKAKIVAEYMENKNET